MKVIGITGGVGAGKSEVLAYLEKEWKAVVCQADEVAHRLQNPGEICYKEIVAFFGREILTSQKEIDRSKLAAIIFNDPIKRQQLNAIVHPRVKTYIKDLIAAEQRRGTALFVLEAALLIEDRYDEICDELWYIYAGEAVRRTRLKEGRKYSERKIDEIIASQMSEAEYRKHCQRIIDNSGSFKDTIRQIRELGETIR